MPIFEKIGKKVLDFFSVCGGFVILFWQALTQLKKKPHFNNTFKQMSHLGVDTLPIVLLTMLFTGIVLTMQTATEFIRFGAQSTIGGVVTIAVCRELGPVLTGVVAAGRVGAAITAEISTMKVTEQIDALRVMAVNPVHYLVVPRLLSCLLMLPLLTVFGDVIGIIGSAVMASYYGVSNFTYMQSINTFVVVHDFTGGLIKAVVFGIVIAIIGCYYGLNADNGAAGVGKSTTQSVVGAIIAIFFLNCFLSLILYR